MADIQHKDITDPEIHEIKGAAAASAGQVPVADGAGEAPFDTIGLASLDTAALYADIEDKIDDATIDTAKFYWILGVIADISTASKIIIPIPESVTFQSARLVLGGTIATANATITFKDSAGNSMGAGVTVAFSGSALGDGYTFTPGAFNVLTAPTYMTVETDGASDNAEPIYIILRFKKVI